ncbi:MAG: M1 family metallopeptidase [Armatimonadetes bacterium]|nr:M1 family metallopeptidase [Armatimonadota bacterium]
MYRTRFSAVLLALSALAGADFTHWAKTYALVNVNYSISFEMGRRSIVGDVTNTIRPLKSGLKEINFDLHGLNVDSITVDSAPATFRREEDVLVVTLPRPSEEGRRLDVRIRYSGIPETGIYFVPSRNGYPATVDMVYTQGEMIDTRCWLPTYDWPDNKATIESRIAVPKGQTAVSNGVLVGVEHEGARDVWHYRMDQPTSTYLIAFAAGQMDETKKFAGTLPVDSYVPDGLKTWGDVAFGKTPEMVQLFNRLTGLNYPFEKYAQIAVPDFPFGGMENTTCTIETVKLLHPASDDDFNNKEGTVAHELAHQWFGDTVTCANWRDAWLHEGFATFMPLFWIRESKGQDAYDLARFDLLETARIDQAKVRPVVWDGGAHMMDLFDGVLYSGGGARLFTLMGLLGEDAFWKGISHYLHKFQFQNVTTADFVNAMSESSGKDLSQWSKQWLFDTVIPTITLSRHATEIHFDCDTDRFSFSLPVWLIDDTKWVKKKVEIKNGHGVLDISDLDGPIIADPEAFLPCGYRYGTVNSEAAWMRIYRKASNIAIRARIYANQRDAMSEQNWERFMEAETNDTLKARMIRNLSTLSVEWLIAHMRDSGPQTKLACLEVLVRHKNDPDVLALCGRIWGDVNAPNTYRKLAFGYLLTTDEWMTYAEDGFRMDTYDDGIRSQALDAFAQHDSLEGRKRCLYILREPFGPIIRAHAVELLGRMKDGPSERTVFNALMVTIKERSFAPRRAAIRALGEYGSPDAIPVLEEMAKHPLHFFRVDAEAALKKIEAQGGQYANTMSHPQP